MSEYRINTIEARRFDVAGGVSPIEIEFHKAPSWAAELDSHHARLRYPAIDALAFSRFAARIALTGSALPPLAILDGSGIQTPLTPDDMLDLALLVASFGRLPTEKDYSKGSRYLALRDAIERRLDLKNIDLHLRGGERQMTLESDIDQVAEMLSQHSLAFSQSPALSFGTFVELIDKYKRVFTFSRGADALLGASALASAYQVAILTDPIVAIELSAGGAGSYIVLKFGGAVGKRVEQFIQGR